MIQFTKLCSSGYNIRFLALEKTNYCGYVLDRIWTVYEHLASAGWLREHASVIHSTVILERKAFCATHLADVRVCLLRFFSLQFQFFFFSLEM